MKISDLVEKIDPNDIYDILRVERVDTWSVGISGKSRMTIPVYKLEQLFGMPTALEESDVNYEWILKITYRNKNHPHYGTEDHDLSTDTTTIVIWDTAPAGTPLAKIEQWQISAKDKQSVWVFQEVLQKNIKATD